MPLRTVHVNIPAHEYDVLVESGLLSSAGPRLRRLFNSPQAGLITDSNVAPLYADVVRQSMESAGFRCISVVIPAGEQHKNLGTLSMIFDQLLRAGVERSTPLVALGGGVVGDITGFAAATTLRGLSVVQMPTTLLSMVDASVGGKTGIDHAVGKNLIGAFHQPSAVLIDPATLRTLPPRELRSGLAECIKHEVIRDAEGFASLEANLPRAIALDLDYLGGLVAHNVTIKARIVEADPFEKGERAHLNFGHTFGHAIETVSNYSYAHGEAVALGMVAAGRTAVKMGLIPAGFVDRIVRLISAAALPTGGLKLPTHEIVNRMLFDKKIRAGKVRFVLPDRIGHVVIRDDVPPHVVQGAIESLAP